MIDQAQSLRSMVKDAENSTLLRTRPEINNKKNTLLKRCKTIAVTSGKGGVGKTNVSINMALSFAKMNKKVLLFDADLGLANVNILMGLMCNNTLLDIVDGRASLKDTIISSKGNIDVIPAGSGIEKLANLDSIALMKLLRDLETLEEKYDYIIFDTGAGISKTVRSFVNGADQQLVVITPEPSSLADAYAVIKMAVNSGAESINIIVNMCDSEKEAETAYKKLFMLTKKFLDYNLIYLGSITKDKNLQAAVIKQQPLFLSYPSSPFAKSISRISLKIMGKSKQKEAGFFKKFYNYIKAV